MVFVKRNSHYSSLPRPRSPVEKYHSAACLERMTVREGADKALTLWYLLAKGRRKRGGVGLAC